MFILSIPSAPILAFWFVDSCVDLFHVSLYSHLLVFNSYLIWGYFLYIILLDCFSFLSTDSWHFVARRRPRRRPFWHCMFSSGRRRFYFLFLIQQELKSGTSRVKVRNWNVRSRPPFGITKTRTSSEACQHDERSISRPHHRQDELIRTGYLYKNSCSAYTHYCILN